MDFKNPKTQKLTNLLRLLIMSLVLFFTSCSKDTLDLTKEHSGIDKNKINLTQFKNETNIKRLDPILQINSKLAINSKIKNQLSAFYIDTLIIKKLVTAQQKATYTFRIYPLEIQKDPLIVYNLVYRSVNTKWEYSIFLIHKKKVVGPDFKPFDKIDLLYDSATATSRSAKSAGIEICAYSTPIVECNGSCKGPCDGWNCSTVECIRYIVTYTVCSSSSPTSGVGGSDPGSQVYTGNSPTDPYSSDPVLFDQPVYDDPNYINAVKRSYVWTNLGEAAQLFFASTPENTTYFNQTIQYQIDENWSPESYDITQEMRIRKMNHPAVFNSINPFLIEKQIDDTQLNPCAKSVFTTVKNTTVCDIAQVLAKLDANGTVYNTTIKSEVAPSGKPAQTVRNSAYNYTIYISTDYTGKTKLFIAASMFHEMIHAYFMSLFDDYSANPPNLTAYNDFAILYQKFVDKKYPGSGDVAHHEQMAIDYVNAIAASLQEFQPGLPQQVYEDLAWGGLQEAPIFNTLFPDGSSERMRIKNRYDCESQGFTIGQGTPQVQSPVGQPCN